MKHLLGCALVGALLAIPAAASADTPGCVSVAEFNNMQRYLSAGQVAARFDTAGSYGGSDSDEFRRNYAACWTSARVAVWYSLNDGLSRRWDVR